MRRPPHDTRRGAGAERYFSHPDFAAADAIEDTYERARAIDAIRHAVDREEDARDGLPSAHQINTILADAFALLLDRRYCTPVIETALRRALDRSLEYRGHGRQNPEVRRRLDCRLRCHARIEDHEATAQIAREVKEEQVRRRLITNKNIDLFELFRDIDEEQAA